MQLGNDCMVIVFERVESVELESLEGDKSVFLFLDEVRLRTDVLLTPSLT